ncbi:MAG: 4Fe-4S single cluster domain-containing protein [Candidatus Thermoplasmatota archaeon]|nr:4Fe-4S single cluster domain-containing protein [Candidatus Thermoplasmatota archaeon]
MHDVLPRSSIYGPGERWVLWVQGCTLGCKGCWNVETWSRRTGTLRTVASLVSELEAAVSAGDLEGISLLGGEPLQQAEPVLELINAAREMGLSVLLYTGYEPEEYDPTMQACHDGSDLVIGGRYVEALRDPFLRWRGSSNQRLVSPTGRYDVDAFEDLQEVEVLIDHDTGQMTVTGYPDADLLHLVQSFQG